MFTWSRGVAPVRIVHEQPASWRETALAATSSSLSRTWTACTQLRCHPDHSAPWHAI